ncbi:hypothetical protein BDK51DRAFT_44203 [Blyttiomyces helicus]|uniref:Uncharacterized protein n=1 Tax=Blyttiomyces helicus TaxID=388810 RepID=A0A4P9VVV8_9FUNG|nr:hypothetical protein BDK51DRAFT_44203 [Blyttiomyces helicus]|eukprot:RKO83811.1 hypothetical protein BDK51DRAFT_44203 [Blyttiomyces helicus]
MSFVTVKLRFVRMAAETRLSPFAQFSAPLANNRLPRAIFDAVNCTSVFVWLPNDEKMVITFESDNLSSPPLEAGGTYDIKADTEPPIDRHQAYSETKFDIAADDFAIVEEGYPWINDLPPTHNPLPHSLSETLFKIATHNSMQSDSARRTILSLYLTYALATVDPNSFLSIAEEVPISLTKKADIEGVSQTVQYNGCVEFLVGQNASRITTKDISCDAALLVLQANYRATLENAHGQVLVQAASVLSHRRERKHRKWAYRTYWAYSDEEKWVFSYVSPHACGKQVLARRTGTIMGVVKWLFDREGCERVFNNIVALVSWAFPSTLGNSLVDVSETGDSSGADDEDLDLIRCGSPARLSSCPVLASSYAVSDLVAGRYHPLSTTLPPLALIYCLVFSLCFFV